MKKKSLIGLLFIAPLMLGIVVFLLYPMVEALRLSFYKTNFIETKFLGINNYRYVLSSKDFYMSLWHTFIMLVYQLVVAIPVSFILACMINKIVRGKAFFRAAFYLPNLTSIVAAVIVFRLVFYSSEAGIANYIIGLVGIKPVAWFGEGPVIQFTTSLLGSWLVLGYYIILFLAGLQSISKELYDAANVDGAKGLKQWMYITIPCSRSSFAFVFVTGVISCMQRFTDVYIIRHQFVVKPIQTILLYIYDTSMVNRDFGSSFAAGYLLFIIIMIISLLNVKITNIFGKE